MVLGFIYVYDSENVFHINEQINGYFFIFHLTLWTKNICVFVLIAKTSIFVLDDEKTEKQTADLRMSRLAIRDRLSGKMAKEKFILFLEMISIFATKYIRDKHFVHEK